MSSEWWYTITGVGGFLILLGIVTLFAWIVWLIYTTVGIVGGVALTLMILGGGMILSGYIMVEVVGTDG